LITALTVAFGYFSLKAVSTAAGQANAAAAAEPRVIGGVPAA